MLIVETKLRKYESNQITLFDVFILNSNVVIFVGDTYISIIITVSIHVVRWLDFFYLNLGSRLHYYIYK